MFRMIKMYCLTLVHRHPCFVQGIIYWFCSGDALYLVVWRDFGPPTSFVPGLWVLQITQRVVVFHDIELCKFNYCQTQHSVSVGW
jgi:hypothetical protein